MIQTTKDSTQRQIEHLSIIIWIVLSLLSLLISGMSFAQGVFLGGALCLINHQWLYRHAKQAVALPPKSSSSFMARRYIIRLTTLGLIIFALISWVRVNVIALLVGLSVVVLSIVCYACYSYIFAEGD